MEEKKQKASSGVKKWIFLILFLIIIFIAIPILAIYFHSPSVSNDTVYQDSIAQLPSIQNSLDSIADAKLTGDYALGGKNVDKNLAAQIPKITEISSTKLSQLEVSDLLADYQKVALVWSIEIDNAQDPKIWKNVPDQPADFRLVLSDSQAKDLFQSSVAKIEKLKVSGEQMIKNKDKDTMRFIAAQILVQNHWLNGVLHSTSAGSLSLNPILPALAQDVPPVKGVDVTCQVCNDPNVKITDAQRKMYNCDTRCKPPQLKTQVAQQETYHYGSDTRKVCLGNNTGGNFCVTDAIQTTIQISASAVDFSEGKSITTDDWDKQFRSFDAIPMPTGTTGVEPSTPSAEGGHLEGGMGTISNGESTTPPPDLSNWDGFYDIHGPVHCSGDLSQSQADVQSSVIVKNNQTYWYWADVGNTPIGPDGHAEIINKKLGWATINASAQFTRIGGQASVKSTITTVSAPDRYQTTCTYTAEGNRIE